MHFEDYPTLDFISQIPLIAFASYLLILGNLSVKSLPVLFTQRNIMNSNKII
jgi:hypothetical protein